MNYLADISIDRDLVFDFFLRFSRFEFALKVTGYALGNDTKVTPDWDRFIRDISSNFLKTRTPELAQACDYFLLNPPKKQVLANRSLGWSTTLPCDPARESELLVKLVRRVRNNLFHGGKYNNAVHEETARNEDLLRGGLLILDECLRVSDSVRAAYDGAGI
jgi:hypothetical protein